MFRKAAVHTGDRLAVARKSSSNIGHGMMMCNCRQLMCVDGSVDERNTYKPYITLASLRQKTPISTQAKFVYSCESGRDPGCGYGFGWVSG